MFLIIEDELGLVSTMMHEAAGDLERQNILESALTIVEEKNVHHGPNLLLLSKSGKVLRVQRSVL